MSTETATGVPEPLDDLLGAPTVSPKRGNGHSYAGPTCACGRRWTSKRECHCSGCHRHFTAVSAFDVHRLGFACQDPATLATETGRTVLAAYERPDGVVWGRWVDPAKPNPFRRQARD